MSAVGQIEQSGLTRLSDRGAVLRSVDECSRPRARQHQVIVSEHVARAE